MRTATQVVAGGKGHPRPGAGPAAGHAVQFYDDEYGAASIAAFLGEALRRDGGALAIATPDHQTEIAEALAAAGIDPGAAVPEHDHPHEQVVNMLEGELALTVAGEEMLLHPGDVVTIRGGVRHSARALAAPCRVLDVFSPFRDAYRFGD